MPGPNRRSRAVGGRPHQLTVTFSDAELAAVTEAAAGAGLAPGAWLGEAGVRAAREAVDGAELPSEWRSALGELMSARAELAENRRLLRNVGGLLNQVAAHVNSTSELHPATAKTLELVAAAVAKAEDGLGHAAAVTAAARTGLLRGHRGRTGRPS